MRSKSMVTVDIRWDKVVRYGDYLHLRAGWRAWLKENIPADQFEFGSLVVEFENEADAVAFILVSGNDIYTN